jgi:8-oxo-dGTP diphosphatase
MGQKNKKEKKEKYILEWLPAPFIAPNELIIQSGGICFNENHKIILVRQEKGWYIPGGHPEENETLEEALIREIAEEACAKVLDYRYLGCIKNTEIESLKPGKIPVFYKARYWVKVQLSPFIPQFETTGRAEILPEEFVKIIGWNAKKTAKPILKAALLHEKETFNIIH